MEGKIQNVEIKLFAPVKYLYKTNVIEEKGIDLLQSGKILNIQIGKMLLKLFNLNFSINPTCI
jgi:hypothetical protein